STGALKEFSCRAVLFNLSFHTSSKPGFRRLSVEIFASVRTQEDRCASEPPVIQSPTPRWADATLVPRTAQMAATANLDMTKTPFGSKTRGHLLIVVYCIVCAL